MSADMTLEEAVTMEAMGAAARATRAYLAVHGDRDACGFAWVTIYGVKMSTKQGKAFAKAGWSKRSGGGIQLWNPSKQGCQSISALEAGAESAANVIKSKFPTLEVYAGSRMD